MSEEIKPQKPMSIEQAGNYLKEKTETIAEDMKREAKKHAVSVALPEDRKRYLMYGISLLEDVSESLKNTWCAITNKAPALYTTKEVSQILRKLLVLRINGYSVKQISHHLHEMTMTIEKAEALAIRAVQEAMTRRKNTGYPIVGGLN